MNLFPYLLVQTKTIVLLELGLHVTIKMKCRFSDGQDAFIYGLFLVCTLIYYCVMYLLLGMSFITSMWCFDGNFTLVAVIICIENIQLHVGCHRLGLHISTCTQVVRVCIANMQLH